MPNLFGLADVTVELYGNACTQWLDAEQRRVYIRRFGHALFTLEEARRDFLELWREIGRLSSPAEVEHAAERWLDRRG
jgi:hypothetical protein